MAETHALESHVSLRSHMTPDTFSVSVEVVKTIVSQQLCYCIKLFVVVVVFFVYRQHTITTVKAKKINNEMISAKYMFCKLFNHIKRFDQF